jgi:hypothetical protein
VVLVRMMGINIIIVTMSAVIVVVLEDAAKLLLAVPQRLSWTGHSAAALELYRDHWITWVLLELLLLHVLIVVMI